MTPCAVSHIIILPVFAGMVPTGCGADSRRHNSPRIRGDGPCTELEKIFHKKFSPYSRGWSHGSACTIVQPIILPVFAGMVPGRSRRRIERGNSPRIRGDGPLGAEPVNSHIEFSPYSRGWSRVGRAITTQSHILPVFAGMVPSATPTTTAMTDSPRIRGDGPNKGAIQDKPQQFSPYSRGWSRGGGCQQICFLILPVFAGMVPPG